MADADWWARGLAFVGTSVALANTIHNYWTRYPRLRVELGYGYRFENFPNSVEFPLRRTTPYSPNVIVVKVTNVGWMPVETEKCEIPLDDGNPLPFTFLSGQILGDELPHELAPGKRHHQIESLQSPHSHLRLARPRTLRAAVTDATGRVWWSKPTLLGLHPCPKKNESKG
jgi:hypothetical protein